MLSTGETIPLTRFYQKNKNELRELLLQSELLLSHISLNRNQVMNLSKFSIFNPAHSLTHSRSLGISF